ncbi:hypothetical protein [Streptomyces sp. 8P21H-1]|uniref:hypothetical protein n=1 Tax=Streptomyces sp. 8P21H-1 TaxID=2737048 RepID=UPI001570FBFF|nr:hypothetical protein [Streptomyces sp. 8P21H-1]NSL43042.1 hypothetical protein [Streptomyces sp. 8P21H-1]
MSGNDERARHDEHGRHGDDEHEQHAGNGTVNHGPSENTGPEESGHPDQSDHPDHSDRSDHSGKEANAADLPSDSPDSSQAGPPADPPGPGPEEDGTPGDSDGADGADGSGDGPGLKGLGLGAEGFGSDELALRRLLHQAVEEIEPTDGTLDHLRRAVPARRARKRQALVGMAAAALFVGTAVPALVHVSNASGPDADPSMAGHASQTQGGSNEGKEASAGKDSEKSPSAPEKSEKEKKKDKKEKDRETSGGSTADVPPPVPSAGVPPCTPTQLTAASGGAAPDATGAVYGSFTVTNVSAAGCTVVGGGSVSPAALGAADPARIGTLLHTAGDAASGLPDPSTYASSLVLPPNGSYYVKFAWVPSAACPTSGGTGGGEPSPDPTPTDTPAGDSGGTSSEGTTGVETQLMRTDGTVDGSVSVSYVAEGGAPSASTTVSNACAGTVYRTGMLSTP